jgi:flagellar biosynthesis/type III secretory pathway protein FliH
MIKLSVIEDAKKIIDSEKFVDDYERFEALQQFFVDNSDARMITDEELEELEENLDAATDAAYDRGYDEGWKYGYEEGHDAAETELQGVMETRMNNEFGAKLIREYDRGVEHGKKVAREEHNAAYVKNT